MACASQTDRAPFLTSLADLDFPLPEERIARHPVVSRSASRLLAVRCGSEKFSHHSFRDLPQLLRKGDLLVINDTKVIPARLLLRKEGGGKVEGLWLENRTGGEALFLLTGNRLRKGLDLRVAGSAPVFHIQGEEEPGHWLLSKDSDSDWVSLLESMGTPPLPPYIRSRRQADGEEAESAEDRDRYQTVWASQAGAVAAPTAGLHFDSAVLERLRESGIQSHALTLHVGQGTFRPVIADRLEDHTMHAESYAISAATLQAIAEARASQRRVVAVGTTVCRALEAHAITGCAEGETSLLIQPGFPFQAVDVLLTNFHTPRSTLLALVAGFAQHGGANDGLAFVKQVYAAAVQEEYRFFSYGDASLWEF